MQMKPLLYLSFCVITLCGCSDQPENKAADYTVTNGPLSVTLERVSLSKTYESNTVDEVIVDVWCILERTDGTESNIILRGLTLMRTDGQKMAPVGITAQTSYNPDNIPWEFDWGTGEKLVLENNQRLLHYRLPQVKGLDKVSQLNIEIRLGLTGQDQKLRSFLFEKVPVR